MTERVSVLTQLNEIEQLWSFHSTASFPDFYLAFRAFQILNGLSFIEAMNECQDVDNPPPWEQENYQPDPGSDADADAKTSELIQHMSLHAKVFTINIRYRPYIPEKPYAVHVDFRTGHNTAKELTTSEAPTLQGALTKAHDLMHANIICPECGHAIPKVAL